MIVITNKLGEDIYGFNILWDLLIKTNNNEIQNDIADLLRDIILGIKYYKMEKYELFWNEIVNKIIYNLKK
jgi:hypothetical protein